MDMGIDLAVQLIDQTASDDLERCQEAVKAGDKAAALNALGQAIARLGAAMDTLRDIPRRAQDLGLGVLP